MRIITVQEYVTVFYLLRYHIPYLSFLRKSVFYKDREFSPEQEKIPSRYDMSYFFWTSRERRTYQYFTRRDYFQSSMVVSLFRLFSPFVQNYYANEIPFVAKNEH